MLRYILAHWRGNLSLAISFWVNAALLSFGLSYLAGMWSRTQSFQEQTTYAWILLAIVAAYTIWSLTGVWRAATVSTTKALDEESGRFPLWAYAAKIMVILAAVFTAITYIPRIGALVFGADAG